MYIDESGDTQKTDEEDSARVLVLTGCIIEESKKTIIERDFRMLKEKYYQKPDIEIKSNFLRYANPDINIDLPLKLAGRTVYDALEGDIAGFLKNIDINLIVIVIDKKAFEKAHPDENPYDMAYIFLCQRFQSFLERKESLGLCIIDPREGGVEKRYFDKQLDEVHNLLRWQKIGFFEKCPRIIERVLFSSSDLTVGIQIADLYCYPVFNVFEYNKKREEYWRFDKLTCPKIYCSGQVKNAPSGPGFKFYPEATKKDFRFFE